MSSKNFSASNKDRPRRTNGSSRGGERNARPERAKELTPRRSAEFVPAQLPAVAPDILASAPLPELLAPSGSLEALWAALDGGADAVYFGASKFNARMNAKNFDAGALSDAINACRSEKVSAYVTLNTLIYDRELDDALNEAYALACAGVDALIVADLGLAELIRKYIPEIPIHASTQASGHNIDAAHNLARLGFSRMVCARELSYENITRLCAESPIGIEMFIHGALCVSHSGQCLMSSFIGGRSGNRGECAQPCRMSYNGGYPLSLRDLCLAPHIPQVIATGAQSLKIEGRMKSPDYVYGVTKIYRKLLDERRAANPDELKRLAELFSRSGFTDGYFSGRLGGMTGIRSDSDKLQTLKTAANSDKNTELRAKKYSNLRAADTPDIPKRFERISAPPRSERSSHRSARCFTAAQAQALAAENFFDIIYLPLEKFDARLCNGAILPPVITDSEQLVVREQLRAAAAAGCKHVLIGNLGHISLCRGLGLTLHGDYRFNASNGYSTRLLCRLLSENEGSCDADVIASPELTLPRLRDISGEINTIVYGRIPLMTLERRLGEKSLRDRTGASFPIVREGGRDILLNSVPTAMSDRKKELLAAGITGGHFIFTTESPDICRRIVDCYRSGRPLDFPVRRIK